MDEWARTWRQLRSGEPQAYEFLLERLGRGVWVYLRRMCGSDDAADELFGRTWLRLVETAGRVRSPHAIRQYVYAIARRQWLDEMRRQRREPPGNAGAESRIDEVVDATPSNLEVLVGLDDVRRLHEAIDRLPELLREVVVLRVYAALMFNEIAELLGLPLGTVLTRMRKATHWLAKELAD